MRRYKKKHTRIGKYRSPLEASVAKRLPKGTEFESEKLTYYLPKKYLPDFVITKPDGKKIYLEVKGYLRYEDQQKMRAVKASNPDLDIRFFFPSDRLVHTSQMLNSEWCEKYGFPCYIARIPKDL